MTGIRSSFGSLRPRPGFAAFSFGLLSVLLLGASRGGYFPGSWGWASFASLTIALASLLTAEARLPARLTLAYIAAIAGITLWTLASTIWTTWTTQTVLESQRLLVYLAGALAAALVVRRERIVPLLAGCASAAGLLSGYALLTRLLPERLGVFDPVSGYRLSEPIGYWNTLGLLAGFGALLSVGLACYTASRYSRALLGATTLVCILTLYFTFSRGAILAVVLAAAAGAAIEPRRIRATLIGAGIALPTAVAVLLASHAEALTTLGSSVAAASAEGHSLLWQCGILTVLAAAGALAGGSLADRYERSSALRIAVSACTALAAASIAALTLAHWGSPSAIAHKAYAQIVAPAPNVGNDLNDRLVVLSSSGRTIQNRNAWHNYVDHPFLGSGAGTYERFYLRERDTPEQLKDVHNLYMQTLTELGPVGLLLLAGIVLMPLVALVRARAVPGGTAGGTAFIAWALHSAVDWDWKITSVTLAGLLCGLAVVVVADSRGERPWPTRLRVTAVVCVIALAGASLVGLRGNLLLSQSRSALERGDWASAKAAAATARSWSPWSTEPLVHLARAEASLGDLPSSRKTLRTAVSMDPRDWELWLALASVETGSARLRAATRARALNPQGPAVSDFFRELAAAP